LNHRTKKTHHTKKRLGVRSSETKGERETKRERMTSGLKFHTGKRTRRKEKSAELYEGNQKFTEEQTGEKKGSSFVERNGKGHKAGSRENQLLGEIGKNWGGKGANDRKGSWE